MQTNAATRAMKQFQQETRLHKVLITANVEIFSVIRTYNPYRKRALNLSEGSESAVVPKRQFYRTTEELIKGYLEFTQHKLIIKYQL